MLHLPDNLHVINQALENACTHFDVILLSGGISRGKFDYIPQALSEIGVTTQFHKVRQKPGKPFWFGTFGEQGVVFALPGNPVSTFLCLLRYALPWLEASLNYPINPHQYAVLDSDVHFEPALQYFVQVKLVQDSQAALRAIPLKNNGSGDYASLLDADAFLELPEDQIGIQRLVKLIEFTDTDKQNTKLPAWKAGGFFYTPGTCLFPQQHCFS